VAAAQMSKRERLTVYIVVGALWLSGCVWLGLDQFFSHPGEFGTTPNFLQPPLLLLHGVLALFGLYLFGYMTARHVVRWWPGRMRRISGGTFAAMLATLTLSGFVLFFVSDDQSQHIAVLIHDVLGIAIVVFAIQHWFIRGMPPEVPPN
jgi:hypothetical protein